MSLDGPHIDDLAERELSACPSPAESPSRSSSTSRMLPPRPKPGALSLLFSQDVASDWWLESQLLFVCRLVVVSSWTRSVLTTCRR